MKILKKCTILACIVLPSQLVMAEGYTAAPGRYQPQNKLEAEQERAMDEWMKEQSR